MPGGQLVVGQVDGPLAGRAEVLDEHVGAGEEGVEALAVADVGGVEAGAALAGVAEAVGRRRPRGGRRARREGQHDVGPEVGQDAAAQGPPDRREVDDAPPGERRGLRHRAGHYPRRRRSVPGRGWGVRWRTGCATRWRW